MRNWASCVACDLPGEPVCSDSDDLSTVLPQNHTGDCSCSSNGAGKHDDRRPDVPVLYSCVGILTSAWLFLSRAEPLKPPMIAACMAGLAQQS